MQLMRHYPLSRHNAFDHFFNNWHSVAGSSRSVAGPAVDITELENAYQLVVDVPGKSAEDITVSVEKQVLTIASQSTAPSTAQHDESKTEVAQRYTRHERQSGDFERRFTLPDSVDAEGIKADCKHGVLTVVIPKSTEATIRTIAVNG